MANIKEQIINWFNGPQDYDQGLQLLQLVSKKNKVIGKLAKRGETRGSVEKLIWELNKVAGLKKIPVPQAGKTKDKSIKTKEKTTKTFHQETDKSTKLKYNLIGDKDIESYPPEVKRLVKEYSSLYMLRGKKHAALKRLGDGNDQETIDNRKPLIDEIKTMSDRLEVLYIAFSGYDEQGFSLDQNFLWPEEKTAGDGQQATGKESIEELKTLKKNIQSSITKDRNSLLYGGKTKPKDGKEKPVPAGPKRTTLEKRIARKEKEIADLDQRIADLG